MSLYLAFRYIEKEEVEFAEGIQHRSNVQINPTKIVKVKNAEETAFYVAFGYDRILRMIYGDYLQIPPKENKL